ncbi:MAG TPA: PPOX class F420-dependent oxidoreductase [Acidimicrobiales bacterium]|nr:PPOX class F420-dependent oxidoreductase [Acidimicrobiales bacterium]
MDLADARAFLGNHHRAVLVTRRGDGRPQLSPIVCCLAGDGRILISTQERAAKARNARRDPQVSLCVLSDGFHGDWIQVDGTAEIVPLPEAMELLVAYYRSISGEHPDWDEYRAAMVEQRRVVLRVTIERAGPDRHG